MLTPEERAELDEMRSHYPTVRAASVSVLKWLQRKRGFLSDESMRDAAEYLGLAVAELDGLATFYNQFSFAARGYYHMVLCNGTSCHMSGSGELLREISKLLEIKDGECTRDGLFSLEVQSCIGACGQSPLMAVNGEYHSGISVKEIREIVKQYREDADR